MDAATLADLLVELVGRLEKEERGGAHAVVYVRKMSSVADLDLGALGGLREEQSILGHKVLWYYGGENTAGLELRGWWRRGITGLKGKETAELNQTYRDDSAYRAEGDSRVDVLIKRMEETVERIHIDIAWMERS